MTDAAPPRPTIPGPTKPLLEVHGIRKDFPMSRGWLRAPAVLRAVDDVSLSVAAGETLGIVGESGSGKSTLGRMVLRLIEPTAGTIRFGEADVVAANAGQLRALRRRMQMIFQDPSSALNPYFTVAQAVAEPLRIHRLAHGAADERERVFALLRKVGLSEELATRLPSALSGGQRQRVVIARALAVEPRFVFCDEPVSALDVSVQAQVLNLLRDLQDELGLTYLFVAHDLSVVRLVSHVVAVMYLGRIVECGPARQLYEEPLHPYTKALLSAISVVDPTRRPTRIPLKGEPPSPLNPPAGCTFHPRCSIAKPGLCDVRRPELVTLRKKSDERQVACHLAE